MASHWHFLSLILALISHNLAASTTVANDNTTVWSDRGSSSAAAGFQLADVIRADASVVVQRGRSVFLRLSDLFSDTAQLLPAAGCRVKIKPHEAMSELTGVLHPRVSGKNNALYPISILSGKRLRCKIFQTVERVKYPDSESGFHTQSHKNSAFLTAHSTTVGTESGDRGGIRVKHR